MRKERKAEKSLGGLQGMVGLEPRADVGKSLQEPWEAQRVPCFTLHSGSTYIHHIQVPVWTLQCKAGGVGKPSIWNDQGV